jgi:phage shock protein PspC (stress-responsive transcriptional regulator)
MRRVVTISLNGNSYQVEEGGYESLGGYLAQAGERLADNPDKAEVLSDLEQAIAEKLGRFLGPHKNVVSAEEVAQVIGEMGPVDGSASGTSGTSGASAETAAGANSSQSSEPHAQKSGSGASRRLYQIREGAMVSGVCNGLAAYFDIDVTIVRVVFVALAIITWGAWILAYIVMMFVIPYAQTGEQHAAAHGWPFNAEELVERAKQNYAQFRAGNLWRRQWREQRRLWRQQRRASRAQWRHGQAGTPPPPPGWDGRAADMSYAAQILGGTLMPLVALFHAVLLVSVFFAIASLITRHAVLGWHLPADVPVWAAVIGVLLLYHVVVSPLRYAHFAGAHHSYYGGVFAIWGALVWMAVVVFVAWMAWWHWPEVQNFLQHSWEQLQGLNEQLTEAVRRVAT